MLCSSELQLTSAQANPNLDMALQKLFVHLGRGLPHYSHDHTQIEPFRQSVLSIYHAAAQDGVGRK
jgi:hypothetical protein